MPKIIRNINSVAKYVGVAKNKRQHLQSQNHKGFRRPKLLVNGVMITAAEHGAGYGYSMLEGGADAFFEWFSWANDPNNTAGVVFQSKIKSGGMKTTLNARPVDPEAQNPEYELYTDVLVESLPPVPPRIHHHPSGIMLRTGLGSRYSQNLALEGSALEVLGIQEIYPVRPTVFLDEETKVFGPVDYPATSGHIYKVEDSITGEIKTLCLSYNMYDRTMVLWDVADPTTVIDGKTIAQSGWWTSSLDQRPDLYFSRDGTRAVALMGEFAEENIDFYVYQIGYIELSIDVSTTGVSLTITNDQELVSTDGIYGFSTGRIPIAADFSYEDANNSLVFAYAELWGVPTGAEENPDYDEDTDSPLKKFRYYAPLSNGGQVIKFTGTPLYGAYPHVDLVYESEDPEQGEILRRTLAVAGRVTLPSGFGPDYASYIAGMDLRYRAVAYVLASEDDAALGSQAFGIQRTSYTVAGRTSYEDLRDPSAALLTGGPTDVTIILPFVLGRTEGGIGLDHQGSIYVHPHTKLKAWVTSYGFFGSQPPLAAEYTDTTPTHSAYIEGSFAGGFASEYKKFVPVPPEEEQLNGMEINFYDFSEPQPTIAWDYNDNLSASRWPTPVRSGVWVVYKKDTSGIE